MIRLYAIRDRLIDYFMKPFTAHSDAQVMASLATVINQPGGTDAISQAPSHYELWRLAEIDEQTGQVGGAREFLADCASLVRRDIRPSGDGRGPAAEGIRGRLDAQAPAAGAPAKTDAGASQDAPRPEAGQGAEKPQGHQGSPAGRAGGAFDLKEGARATD